MKKQGTSKFVTELVTGWLKQIRDPATLDDFEKMIKERRAMLMIETNVERADKCVEEMARCKQGDKLFMMKAFPTPAAMVTTAALKYKEEMNRMQCTFWQWKPRRKELWVTVPWTTKRKHHGKNFILLKVRDIKRLQPSRTESEIRLQQQQRR